MARSTSTAPERRSTCHRAMTRGWKATSRAWCSTSAACTGTHRPTGSEVPAPGLVHQALKLDGQRYLVAPRGHTQWVRNLRVSGSGRLLVGRRAEAFSAAELDDLEKPTILRAYLKRWKWEVGQFFGGVGPDAGDDELRRIAPDHPVFRITA